MSAVLALAFALITAGANRATAATRRLVGPFPHSSSKSIAFTLNGDQVVGLTTGLTPTSCASPASWASDSDADFTMDEPPGASLSLSSGTLTFSGTATSAFYGSGPASDPYGAQFTVMVDGRDAPHTLATGTVSMTGARDNRSSADARRRSLHQRSRSVAASPIKANKSAYQSQFINFDYSRRGHHPAVGAGELSPAARARCRIKASTAPSSRGRRTGSRRSGPTRRATSRCRPTSSTRYSEIVQLSISGHINHGKASGRIIVSEAGPGYTGIAGLACHGNYAWHAAIPVPPPPPGPTAFFQWVAIRVPVGGAYRYYFALTGLQCSDHANELLVTVEGRRIVIPCSRSSAFASGPLAPSRTYGVTSQAVEVSGGRLVRKGSSSTVPVTMPGPGDIWVIISGLPGAPPS